MCRWVRPNSKITRRSHKASPKMIQPDPIHNHSRSQWIVSACNCLREFKSPASFLERFPLSRPRLISKIAAALPAPGCLHFPAGKYVGLSALSCNAIARGGEPGCVASNSSILLCNLPTFWARWTSNSRRFLPLQLSSGCPPHKKPAAPVQLHS